MTKRGALSKLYPATLTILLVILGKLTYVLAQDTGTSTSANSINPPVLRNKQVIKDGIRLYITPRGLTFFENRLPEFLDNLGISLEYAFFPQFSYQNQEKIDITQLPKSEIEQKKWRDIHYQLSRLFTNFPGIWWRPKVFIEDIFYQARFQQLALVTDEELLRQLSKKEGAILVLQVLTESIELSIKNIEAKDLEHLDLGTIALQEPRLKVGPFFIRIPMWVNINRQTGFFEFEALPIHTDMEKTPFEFRYKNLLLPKITVTIGQRQMNLNEKVVAEFLDKYIPDVVKEVKKVSSAWLEGELPKKLNDLAKTELNKNFEELNILVPPGAPHPGVSPFYWGMQPRALSQNKGLWLTLDTFVEDPVLGPQKAVPRRVGRSQAQYKRISIQNYDLLLSLDEDFINRILQLSFLRGYFQEVESEPGKPPLKLLEPLRVSGSRLEGAKLLETKMRVFLHARAPKGSVTGLKKLVLRDEFSFRIPLWTRLEQEPQGVAIVLERLEVENLQLGEDALTSMGRLMPETVKNGVKEELNLTNQKWAQTPTLLPGHLPLPPEIFGLKTQVQAIQFEEAGHLVLYLAYQQPSQSASSPLAGGRSP
jgi:hypothetical protein